MEGNILPDFEAYSQIISYSLTPSESEKTIISNKRLKSYMVHGLFPRVSKEKRKIRNHKVLKCYYIGVCGLLGPIKLLIQE